MEIFNTLSRRKEESVPLIPGKIKMYVCGPMVYNFIHIGNVRSMIVFDTVRGYSGYKGYDIHYVPNFVGMNDKIVKETIEEGVDANTVPRQYIEEHEKNMAVMNVKPATVHPQVIQEICGMLEMIQTPINKDHTYVVGDGIMYFRTSSFKEYGELSYKNPDELQSRFRETRVTDEGDKEDPNDFVFWKPKKEGEPFQESPWCDGHPGWYIEYSVTSKRYLGEWIDIHVGGEDLAFPHYENEIAQSGCANNKSSTTYWIHSGFLNIDDKKTSRSLGSFFIVREISEKYDSQVLRFFILSAHYRSPLNFGVDLMEASKNGLERILTCVEKLGDPEAKASNSPRTAEEQGNMEEAGKLRGKYGEAMDDDLNTADTISAVFEPIKLTSTTVGKPSTKEFVPYMKTMMEEPYDILGIITEKKEEVLNNETEETIETRQRVRKEKNFAPADETRRKLLDMGIILEGIGEDAKWKRA